eukprot:TRINITY_DN113175_c0_g1_i1.p1 TRINITY_DN113175_c0_g1~~TRINITY_DN113175_c0_g1_i1.p1  ORF type:complete len:617 (+),score=91.89 TRINITY_DN113175_c0_g1_i1:91-1941(+)
MINREERERAFELMKKNLRQEAQSRPATKAIPGYTGHVRNCKDIFGQSAGTVLEQDAKGGIGSNMLKPTKASVGSTFISALDSDGAVWDHKYETTNQNMNVAVESKLREQGQSTGPRRNVVGYTGHVHMAQDILGASHDEVVRMSENARAEQERQRARKAPPEPEQSKPHWTQFVMNNRTGAWKQDYTSTLTTRPSSRKPVVTKAMEADRKRQQDERLQQEYNKAKAAMGDQMEEVSSPVFSSTYPQRGANAGQNDDEFIDMGPAPLYLKDNTLMTEAPEDEKGYTGHYSAKTAAARRIVGYTGHLHGAQDSIGLNFGRLERRTNPFRRGAQEPHPLGARYQNAAPPGPAVSADVRELVGRTARPRKSGIPIIDTVKTKILQRGGRNGFRTLVRILKIMDDDGNRKLNRYEFQNGLNTYGIFPNQLEMDELMMYFDADNSGLITVTEFMKAVTGEMSERRKNLVRQAYALLDTTCDGVVTLKELKGKFDATKHPEVLAGDKTIKEVLTEFAKSWDKNEDGQITLAEFMDYYHDISAGIDLDDYFELMIRNAWHMSGGEGVAQCTSCRRVLVIHEDGHQTVEEIKNDLGIGPNDEDKMIRKLQEQGIMDIKKIKLYG